MLRAEDFREWPQASADGQTWRYSQPLPAPLIVRLRDAWQVLMGRAEAVRFGER